MPEVSDPFDLAQLVALSALLEEQNVTKAARRLGVSQSTMSYRLARLRASLGDELLVRQGRALLRTPFGDQLADPLAAALSALRQVVVPPRRFEPRVSNFTLEVVFPDVLAPLIAEVVAHFSREAPNVQLVFRGLGSDLNLRLEAPMPCLAFAPTSFVSDEFRSRALGSVRFLVAARTGHPALAGKLSLAKWLAFPHISVQVGNRAPNHVEVALQKAGIKRRVGLEVPSFLSGLLVLPDTDYLMNVPMPVARAAVMRLGLQLKEPPLALPNVAFSLLWHARWQQHSAHAWAREQLHALTRSAFGRLESNVPKE